MDFNLNIDWNISEEKKQELATEMAKTIYTNIFNPARGRVFDMENHGLAARLFLDIYETSLYEINQRQIIRQNQDSQTQTR